MLVVRRAPGSVRRTRDAFTLIEVLVVVAILVILASVATVGMMRYLDTAKENKAKMDAQNIHKAMKAYWLAHEQWPDSLTMLIGGDQGKSFLDGGEKAITDPWGKYYQMRIDADPNTGEDVPVVWTTNPTGVMFGWPKEYMN